MVKRRIDDNDAVSHQATHFEEAYILSLIFIDLFIFSFHVFYHSFGKVFCVVVHFGRRILYLFTLYSIVLKR